ncbi:MAG: DUF1800 family protein [Saprospiraceae bacterium]|nr:DUF1800 family protein [Saprospiraceae bacterium]
MIRTVLSLGSFIIISAVSAQNPNYLGGGNVSGITVSASSSYKDPSWPVSSNPNNTINPQGMLALYFDAGRFLNQATIGFDSTDVTEVISLGIAGWLDQQFAQSFGPSNYMLTATENVYSTLNDTLTAQGLASEIDRRPTWKHFNYAWWQTNTLTNHLLRHKVACALIEILVISRNSELSQYGDGLASYYDIMLKNAFGNYRNILYDVSLHPCMGFYLSHLNNPKTDTLNNVHPDENYAREVEQLFSIGLYELNPDGSRKKANGEDIPTYDNADIQEFAKIFTGLGVGGVVQKLVNESSWDNGNLYFGRDIYNSNVTIPMIMYNNEHESGQKHLLNGFTVPAGQTGLQDINSAIDNLFNHPNIGPFIGYKLIQRLVKSNPSPAYIQRVSTAFNGAGPYGTTRGDMKSVLKAIFLDPEAREAPYQLDAANSKLQEPIFRYTHAIRALDKYNPNNFYWNINYSFYEDTKQDIFASPSVFNFFLPTDAPNGPIHDQGLVAPEFKLHDARTSVGYINNVYRWTQSWGELMGTWEGDIMNHTEVTWVIDDLLNLAKDTEALINWYDKHLLCGRMTDRTRKLMRSALNRYESTISWHNYQENRVRMGLYLALIAPEYSIIK